MIAMDDKTQPKFEYVPPAGLEARVRATPCLVRWLLRFVALVCLLLAAMGVILPGLPTTPFILVTAWAAARSSPALLRWLYRHGIFGPMLHNWDHGRTVSRKAKWAAAITMVFCAVVMLVLSPKLWMALIPCGIMACVLTWLWSRPEPSSAVINRTPDGVSDRGHSVKR